MAGDTPVGRAMQRVLVEAPARWLSRWSAGQLLLMAMLAGTLGTAMLTLEKSDLQLVAMMAPEAVAWITAFEVGAYLDAAIAVVLSASMLRGGGMRGWIGALAARVRRGTARAPRGRPARRKLLPDNDDEDPAGLALAA